MQCQVSYVTIIQLFLSLSITHTHKNFSAAPIDLSNIKKLRVKQLRQILAEHGETCKNCVEKRQYVEMVEKLVAKQQGGKEL